MLSSYIMFLISLQSFLGFANIYHMFILQYSNVIVPMWLLLKRDQMFSWDPDCQSFYEKLKYKFSSTPLLQHADTTRPFITETNPLGLAIASIFSKDFDGKTHSVAYYARKLTAPKINYKVHDKELVVAYFYQWRPFLLSNAEPIKVSRITKTFYTFHLLRS